MLKTSLDVAEANASQLNQAASVTPAERYNRALELMEAGMFPSVAEAGTYLDLLERCRRGEQLTPEMQKFVDDGRKLEEQLSVFVAARQSAVEQEAQIAQLRGIRNKLGRQLQCERDRLASLPADPLKAAYLDYQRYLGEGSYPVLACAGPALEALKVKLYKKFVSDVVIPDLENQLRAADADLAKLLGTTTPEAA